LHALARFTTTAIHDFRDIRRTDERNAFDRRMRTNGLDDVFSAIDEIHDARGQTRFLNQLKNTRLRQRDLLARLEHERISRGDRIRQKPQRHHRGEIERRNRGKYAHRLTYGLTIDVCRDVFERLTHHQRRNARRMLGVLNAAAEIVERFRHCFAMLARANARNLFAMSVEYRTQFEQIPSALGRRDRSPRRKCRLRRLHRSIDVISGR